MPLSNLCVDGRAGLKESETERWIDARGVRERVAVEAGVTDERAQPRRRSTRPRRVELYEHDQPVVRPSRAEAELLFGRPRGVAQLLVADLGAGGCAVPKGQRDALVYNCKV